MIVTELLRKYFGSRVLGPLTSGIIGMPCISRLLGGLFSNFLADLKPKRKPSVQQVVNTQYGVSLSIATVYKFCLASPSRIQPCLPLRLDSSLWPNTWPKGK